MARVEIYSSTICPYCVRAKKLLESKGVMNYVEYNIQEDAAKREEMLKRTNGARTVPQIFINDVHYGGCDDLYALDAIGKLDEVLHE